MRCAEWMHGLIQQKTQSNKKPNFESWACEIRMINDLDERDLQLIAKVFKWAHAHHFWCGQILSPAKLRKQFDVLFTQMNEEASRAQNRPGGNPAAPGRKPTPAERVEIARQKAIQRELATESPAVGSVVAVQ